MCGVAGIFTYGDNSPAVDPNELRIIILLKPPPQTKLLKTESLIITTPSYNYPNTRTGSTHPHQRQTTAGSFTKFLHI